MFEDEYKILHEYLEYFLDFRELLAPTIRWTDRLQSSFGDWTGNLFAVWENQGWIAPQVMEEYLPDRTILKLSFVRNELKKVTEKTERQKEFILSRMQPDMEYKVTEVAQWLEVGRTRARTLLKMLIIDGKILETGTTKMKRYQMIK